MPRGWSRYWRIAWRHLSSISSFPLQLDDIRRRNAAHDRLDMPRPSRHRRALFVGEGMPLIDGTIPAKLPLTWFKSFSMTGRLTPSRAMPDATVRRISCKTHGEVSGGMSASRRHLILLNALTGTRPVSVRTHLNCRYAAMHEGSRLPDPAAGGCARGYLALAAGNVKASRRGRLPATSFRQLPRASGRSEREA